MCVSGARLRFFNNSIFHIYSSRFSLIFIDFLKKFFVEISYLRTQKCKNIFKIRKFRRNTEKSARQNRQLKIIVPLENNENFTDFFAVFCENWCNSLAKSAMFVKTCCLYENRQNIEMCAIKWVSSSNLHFPRCPLSDFGVSLWIRHLREAYWAYKTWNNLEESDFLTEIDEFSPLNTLWLDKKQILLLNSRFIQENRGFEN